MFIPCLYCLMPLVLVYLALPWFLLALRLVLILGFLPYYYYVERTRTCLRAHALPHVHVLPHLTLTPPHTTFLTFTHILYPHYTLPCLAVLTLCGYCLFTSPFNLRLVSSSVRSYRSFPHLPCLLPYPYPLRFILLPLHHTCPFATLPALALPPPFCTHFCTGSRFVSLWYYAALPARTFCLALFLPLRSLASPRIRLLTRARFVHSFYVRGWFTRITHLCLLHGLVVVVTLVRYPLPLCLLHTYTFPSILLVLAWFICIHSPTTSPRVSVPLYPTPLPFARGVHLQHTHIPLLRHTYTQFKFLLRYRYWLFTTYTLPLRTHRHYNTHSPLLYVCTFGSRLFYTGLHVYYVPCCTTFLYIYTLRWFCLFDILFICLVPVPTFLPPSLHLCLLPLPFTFTFAMCLMPCYFFVLALYALLVLCYLPCILFSYFTLHVCCILTFIHLPVYWLVHIWFIYLLCLFIYLPAFYLPLVPFLYFVHLVGWFLQHIAFGYLRLFVAFALHYLYLTRCIPSHTHFCVVLPFYFALCPPRSSYLARLCCYGFVGCC